MNAGKFWRDYCLLHESAKNFVESYKFVNVGLIDIGGFYFGGLVRRELSRGESRDAVLV